MKRQNVIEKCSSDLASLLAVIDYKRLDRS